MNFLLVGLGGMIGAVLRFVVISVAWAGIELWLINGLGSFALGLLNGVLTATNKHKKLRLFWGTGLLGAFTTFSSFSAEWFELLRASLVSGLLYGIGMTMLCMGLAWIGLIFGQRRG